MTVIKKVKPLKRKPLLVVTAKEEKKKTRKNSGTLPPDDYKNEFEPIDLDVDETRKFVLSVCRGGDLGLPMCDIRQFQMTERYTGFTKKGINFPVELLPDLVELLHVVYGECEERGLLPEIES